VIATPATTKDRHIQTSARHAPSGQVSWAIGGPTLLTSMVIAPHSLNAQTDLANRDSRSLP